MNVQNPVYLYKNTQPRIQPCGPSVSWRAQAVQITLVVLPSLFLYLTIAASCSYILSQETKKIPEMISSLLVGLICSHKVIRAFQEISIKRDQERAKIERKSYFPLANSFQKFFTQAGNKIIGRTRWTARQCIPLFCSSKESVTERACLTAKTFFSMPLAFFSFCLSVPFYLAASYAGTGRFEIIEASTPGLEMPSDKVHVVFQNICGQNPWSFLSGGVLPPFEEGPDGKARIDQIIANILEKKPDFFGGQEFDDLDTSQKMAEVLSQHGYTCVRDLGCHSPIFNHSGLFMAVGPEAAASIHFHPFSPEDTTGITSWCDRGLLEVTIPLQNGTSLKIINLHLNAGGEDHHKTRLLQIQKYLSPLMQKGPVLAIGDANLDTSLLTDAEKKACRLEKFVNALEGEVTCTDEGKHQLYGKPKEECLDEKIDVALFDPQKGSVSDVKIEPGYSDHSLISFLFST